MTANEIIKLEDSSLEWIDPFAHAGCPCWLDRGWVERAIEIFQQTGIQLRKIQVRKPK